MWACLLTVFLASMLVLVHALPFMASAFLFRTARKPMLNVDSPFGFRLGLLSNAGQQTLEMFMLRKPLAF
jgi:hypothetical protein